MAKSTFNCSTGWSYSKGQSTACTGKSDHDESTQKDYVWSGKNARNEVGCIVSLCQYHFDNSNRFGWTYSGNTLTLLVDTYALVDCVCEAACKQCSRKNFTNAKKCWWCETENPTV